MFEPSEPERSAPRTATKLFLIAVLCAIWGSTWLAVKYGVQAVPPMTAAFWRYVIATVVMALACLALGAREGGDRPTLRLSVSQGLLNMAIPYGLVYYCETYLPSGMVSLLWSTFPLMIAGAGHVALPDEQLRGRQWFGFVIGFAGVALLFATDVRRIGLEALPVAALCLLSPMSASIGTVIVKRYGKHTSSLRLNRNGMALCAIALLAASAGEPTVQVWSTRAIVSVVYLAVLGSVVAFGLYYWLLRWAAAYQMSLIAYITPVIAVLLGWAVDGEPVTGYTLTGGTLILAGVFAVAMGAGKPSR